MKKILLRPALALAFMLAGIGTAHAMYKCTCSTGSMETVYTNGVLKMSCSDGGTVTCIGKE